MNLLEAEEKLVEIKPKGTFLSATITKSLETIENEIDEYLTLAAKIADAKYDHEEIASIEALLNIYDFLLDYFTLETLPMLYKEAIAEDIISIAKEKREFLVDEILEVNEYLVKLKGEKILT